MKSLDKEEQKSKKNGKETKQSPVFTGNFESDLKKVKDLLGENSDILFRKFRLNNTKLKAALFYLDGLSDKELIDKFLLSSLMKPFSETDKEQIKQDGLKDFLKNNVLSIGEIKESDEPEKAVIEILNGSAALIIESVPEVLVLGIKKPKTRDLQEPISEPLVRGPRIGFTENIKDNTAILRNQGQNEDLFFLKKSVGERAKKQTVIAYINGIANQDLVDEIVRRIDKIKIDFLPESGYIEQLIEDNFLSPFPQIQSTERPDRVMGALMEGRVAILLDGTPYVLIAPVTLSMLLQSPEDYYERWIPATLVRLLRFLAAFITLYGPSLYISFISFHPGLIPTKLAISIAGSREGVPFPTLLEAMLMEIAIEILREAGLRLPKPIGPAIGIVGGLIIGEAAVSAGIVSRIMVIVVALTAISSFAMPQYSLGTSLRILRFISMLAASIYGLYGVVLFTLLFLSHLVRLYSFGVPYISPWTPLRMKDLKDFIVRGPMFLMKSRPVLLQTKEPRRKG
ncbi:spore germination protein [Mesobacillus zeae]|uniref:Spore germination protein n=1 Tax=Mesobacillus zeae TaxID=1917180 RepID=A0A398BFA9_9BACI|nr:spore germination protein [Mesobacillus zeae]RID88274.1 spore germination protein [Mesobacillus zeae]